MRESNVGVVEDDREARVGRPRPRPPERVKRCATALPWLLLGAQGASCTLAPPAFAPFDPPPETLLVVINRSSLGGIRALESPPELLVLGDLPRDEGAQIDLLGYDRPLARLGLRARDYQLELALDDAAGVPLPLPHRWLSGTSTDVTFVSTETSSVVFAAAFAGIRVAPRCPEVSIVGDVVITDRKVDAVAPLGPHTAYVASRRWPDHGIRHAVLYPDRSEPIRDLSNTSTRASDVSLVVSGDGETWVWAYARDASSPALHQLSPEGAVVRSRPLMAPESDVPIVASRRGDSWVWGGAANTLGLVDLDRGEFVALHQRLPDTCELSTETRVVQLDDRTNGVVSFIGGATRNFTLEDETIVIRERTIAELGPSCRAARDRDALDGREVIVADGLGVSDVWWRERAGSPWQRWTSAQLAARAVALAGAHIVLVDRAGSVSVLDVSSRVDLPPRWCPGPPLGLSVSSLTRVGEYVVAAGSPALDGPNRVVWLRVE